MEFNFTNGTIASFDAFMGTVKSSVEAIYSDGYTVEIREIRKNNGKILNGLTIHKIGVNIAPTIYLDRYYEAYKKGYSLYEIVKDIMDTYEKNKVQNFDVMALENFENVKGKICCKLINTEKNKELLERVPYVQFMDLSIVFYILVSIDHNGNASIPIRNEYMKMWGKTANDILEVSKTNTRKLLGFTIVDLFDIAKKHMNQEDIMFYENCDELPSMYVVTNKSCINGAVNILFDEELRKFAECIEDGFYIIPSSINETIWMPVNGMIDIDEIRNMVKEANFVCVEANEVLSDSVYYYDRALGKIKMC